jgi:hypothetical protein
MSLPALSDWGHTRIALHQAAQVVGAIRKIDAEPLPNYLHVALEVVPAGLTSGKLAPSIGGELVLDLPDAAIIYVAPGGDSYSIPIGGNNQTTLMDAVLDIMAKSGHPANPDRSKISGEDSLRIHPGMAEEYHITLYTIYTAMARFRARLFGPMSRMVVWPHGFDLSFLWFARGFDEGSDPHLNFGFSPGSPGFDRPYVYAYAHPKPPGMMDIKLPDVARWNTEPWTGIVIDYDSIAGDINVESTLEQMLLQIHTGLAPLLL